MNDQTPSGNAKDDETPPSNGRRMLLDFGPLLLFFGANYLYSDLMLSVKVLVVTTIMSLAASWVLERRVPMMAAHLFARLPMNAKFWQQGWPPSWCFAEFKVNNRALPSCLAINVCNISTF